MYLLCTFVCFQYTSKLLNPSSLIFFGGKSRKVYERLNKTVSTLSFSKNNQFQKKIYLNFCSFVVLRLMAEKMETVHKEERNLKKGVKRPDMHCSLIKIYFTFAPNDIFPQNSFHKIISD